MACHTSQVSTPFRASRSAATLEEVAARAGVSRATASRVLRGAANVSAAARTAVQKAAEEIRYTPNRAARSLVTGRSDSVAFLVNETEERMFTEPFFLGMLRAAQEAAAGSEVQLTFVVASTPEQRDRFVSYASGGHVDGVLVLSTHGDDTLQSRLESVGVPTVLSGRPYSDPSLFHVDADNVAGGRLATEHLLRTGRRRLGIVTGPMDMCAGLDRYAGYRAALADAGLALDETLVEVGGFSAGEGYAAGQRLLERRPDLDAIVAPSDLAAVGVIRAVQQVGRSVPDDVGVVGFDDVREAAEHHPSLTTIRQPIAELGATMTHLLLARLAGDEPESAAVVLPVELVVRDSA